MRYLVAVFVLALPLAANAQVRVTVQSGQTVPPPVVLPFQTPPPQPAGGLTTGFPLTVPDRFNPPPDLFRVRPGEPFNTRSRLFLGGFVGGYGPYMVPGEPASATANALAPPPPGMLRFAVTPLSAQVFVDSYYVGTVEDIDHQRVLTLPPGPHRVEIRAPEYEPVAFDVRIESNETITYRATLDRSRREPPPRAAAPSGPTRMYVIPNCYLGNIPPRQDRLPSGCSTKQVRVIGDR
jgi:hypothetical protein